MGCSRGEVRAVVQGEHFLCGFRGGVHGFSRKAAPADFFRESSRWPICGLSSSYETVPEIKSVANSARGGRERSFRGPDALVGLLCVSCVWPGGHRDLACGRPIDRGSHGLSGQKSNRQGRESAPPGVGCRAWPRGKLHMVESWPLETSGQEPAGNNGPTQTGGWQPAAEKTHEGHDAMDATRPAAPLVPSLEACRLSGRPRRWGGALPEAEAPS